MAPSYCLGDLRPAGTFVTTQHGEDLSPLRFRPRVRAINGLGCRSACRQRGAKVGDGVGHFLNTVIEPLIVVVPRVEQGLRGGPKTVTAARPTSGPDPSARRHLRLSKPLSGGHRACPVRPEHPEQDGKC